MHCLLLFSLYFLLSKGICNSQEKFSMFGYAKPNILSVGSQTTLYCKITSQSKLQFSQRWSAPLGQDIAEQCSTYNVDDKSMTAFCNNSESDKYVTMNGLHISKVTWSHRGDWLCHFVKNSTKVFLDVRVPTVVHELSVAPLPNSVSQLLGTGTKDQPYDLRGGLGAQLTCITKCSYPKSQLNFKFESEFRPVGAYLPRFEVPDSEQRVMNNIRLQSDEQCAQDKLDLLRPSYLRTRFLNCSSVGMDGLTAVSCISSANNYQVESHKKVYFTCPDFPNSWAQKPTNVLKISSGDQIEDAELKLTVGETVAIVMGSVISVFLLIGLMVVIKRQLRLNNSATVNRRCGFGDRDIVEL